MEAENAPASGEVNNSSGLVVSRSKKSYRAHVVSRRKDNVPLLVLKWRIVPNHWCQGEKEGLVTHWEKLCLTTSVSGRKMPQPCWEWEDCCPISVGGIVTQGPGDKGKQRATYGPCLGNINILQMFYKHSIGERAANCRSSLWKSVVFTQHSVINCSRENWAIYTNGHLLLLSKLPKKMPKILLGNIVILGIVVFFSL